MVVLFARRIVQPGPRQCLVLVHACKDPEDDRNVTLEIELHDALRHSLAYVFKVHSLPFDQTSDANHCIDPLTLAPLAVNHPASSVDHLVRTRHLYDLRRGPTRGDFLLRAGNQRCDDSLVPPGFDDNHVHASSIHLRVRHEPFHVAVRG